MLGQHVTQPQRCGFSADDGVVCPETAQTARTGRMRRTPLHLPISLTSLDALAPAPRGCNQDLFRRSLMFPLIDGAEVVVFPKVFPALQRDREVAVFPEEIVKRSQAELVALSELGIGEKMQDLTLPDLIADGLPWGSGK